VGGDGRARTLDREQLGEFSNWYPSYLPFAYKTPEELVQIRKRILRRFYLRPRYVWGRIAKVRTLRDVGRYLGLVVDFLSMLHRLADGGRGSQRLQPPDSSRVFTTLTPREGAPAYDPAH
jgi:hypothetical protein